MVPYPYTLYLTVISDFTDSAAEFTISYWYEDRDPESLTEEEKASDSLTVAPEQETIIKEQALTESPLFFLLVAVSALVFLVAVICCACLIQQ